MRTYKVPFLKHHNSSGPSSGTIWHYMRLRPRRIQKMSAPLIVSIPHRLGREEATRRLKAGLTRAASSIPVLKVDEERWEDNRMIFRVRALGQAASGHLDVADDQVRVEVTLPWLLQRFAEVAQAAIKNRGKLLLTKGG
jgi:Putative polyhydroxyalkanoic acid system protein (PHA_gran_rgn)